MKKIIFTLLLMWSITACSDGDDVFYTVDYPITDIQVTVDVEGTSPDSPMIRDITDHVEITAPVQVGGTYSLDFSVYNGGVLRVRPNAEAEIILGTFIKEPGKRAINFIFGEENYTAKTSYFQLKDKDPETGLMIRKTVFIVDLTEKYQAMYPDKKVNRVTRYEYTATTTK